jgi:hypothetical protein
MGEPDVRRCFFVTSSYLSTATVLYQRGGFSDEAITKLQARTAALSFDEIYAPGAKYELDPLETILAAYRAQLFGAVPKTLPHPPLPNAAGTEDQAPPAEDAAPAEEEAAPDDGAGADGPTPKTMPSIALARHAWQALMDGSWPALAAGYTFDLHPLSNEKPYFAAYLRPRDLPAVLDRLDLLQDEWGYLLLWATLFIACASGLLLIALPAIFGWRSLFARCPGKAGTLLYFACLGMGYIMVEVALISHFTLALSNATVSAAVLITGMLVFSGIGSLVAERHLDRARTRLPFVFATIALLLVAYGFGIDRALDWVGTLPYTWRLPCCFALIFPPAFLMGMPMPTGMTWLARLGKAPLFLWAWGVNGCMSVVGAAAVPILATSFGVGAALVAAGALYLLAVPGLFALLRPLPGGAAAVA